LGPAAYSHIQPPAEGGELLWAKALENWHNHPGNGSFVRCRPCADHEGAGADGDAAVTVYLPRATNTDPNVVADQVIGYRRAANGINVAATGHLDDAIGTVKMWSIDTGDPPPGWSECGSGGAGNITKLEGRFPLAKVPGDPNFGAVGRWGGYTQHCHQLELDAESPPCDDIWITEGTYQTRSISTKTADHMPPWCVVRFIERIDNSI
jgi:hypothetical protein